MEASKRKSVKGKDGELTATKMSLNGEFPSKRAGQPFVQFVKQASFFTAYSTDETTTSTYLMCFHLVISYFHYSQLYVKIGEVLPEGWSMERTVSFPRVLPALDLQALQM